MLNQDEIMLTTFIIVDFGNLRNETPELKPAALCLCFGSAIIIASLFITFVDFHCFILRFDTMADMLALYLFLYDINFDSCCSY